MGQITKISLCILQAFPEMLSHLLCLCWNRKLVPELMVSFSQDELLLHHIIQHLRTSHTQMVCYDMRYGAHRHETVTNETRASGVMPSDVIFKMALQRVSSILFLIGDSTCLHVRV